MSPWLEQRRSRTRIALVAVAASLLAALLVYRRAQPETNALPAAPPGRGALSMLLQAGPGLPLVSGRTVRADLNAKVRRCHDEKAAADRGGTDIAPPSIEAMLADLGRQLAPSPAATDRALGAYLSMTRLQDRAMADFEAARPGCASDPKCQADASRAAETAGNSAREAVVRLASTTDRPEVYALAFYACHSSSEVQPSGPCTQLSAEQWARLEPGNATPWLFAADAAQKRGDAAALDEAMFRASQAPFNDSHESVFGALLQPAELQAQPLQVQVALDVGVFAIAAGLAYPGYGTAEQYCSVEAIGDPNRRQVCTDLARMMAERSDTLVSLALGLRLAERVGWPPDQLEALQQRWDAYEQIVPQDPDLDNCEALGALDSIFVDALHHGQVGALRRAVAASGRTEAQLGQLAQRRRAELKSRAEEVPAKAPEAR